MPAEFSIKIITDIVYIYIFIHVGIVCPPWFVYQTEKLTSAARDCIPAGGPITPPLFCRRGRVIGPPHGKGARYRPPRMDALKGTLRKLVLHFLSN